jgi:GDP-L-fucose synthase
MILVTGGTGFVGRHLQEELKRRGIDFAIFSKREYDLTSREQTDAVFARYRDANIIIHFACFQAAGDFPAKHTGDQFQINSLIHLNVLESWRKLAPQARLIAVGSSCAYPSRLDVLAEDRFMDGEIHGSVYSYAFTKRLLYTGIAAYNGQYGLHGSYIIPPTLFGEHDDFDLATAHVTGALIAKFVRAVREDLPEVEIWGDGSQVREFLYVKDFVSAVLDLLPKLDGEVLNVAPGRGTSIRDLAVAIGQAAAFKGRIVYNAGRYVGVQEKFLNTEKLQNKYGVRIKGDLARGIARTVDWYSAHYDEVKHKPKFAQEK